MYRPALAETGWGHPPVPHSAVDRRMLRFPVGRLKATRESLLQHRVHNRVESTREDLR
jgi:hypothetical protein